MTLYDLPCKCEFPGCEEIDCEYTVEQGRNGVFDMVFRCSKHLPKSYVDDLY